MTIDLTEDPLTWSSATAWRHHGHTIAQSRHRQCKGAVDYYQKNRYQRPMPSLITENTGTRPGWPHSASQLAASTMTSSCVMSDGTVWRQLHTSLRLPQQFRHDVSGTSSFTNVDVIQSNCTWSRASASAVCTVESCRLPIDRHFHRTFPITIKKN